MICTAVPGPASANKKVIAFAQDTLANDFRKAQVFEVRDAVAKYPDLTFIYSDAKGQTSLLVRQIEKFISAKVDILIVGTNDANAVVPVITKAHKQGLPVIILDRGINSNNYATFINSDNIEIGAIGAKYIAKRLNGTGTVLLFEGLQKADVTRLRSRGFLDEISQHKKIKVIKRTGNYLRKDAIFEMEKLIAQGIHLDAIFSESDSMLSGVRSVLLRHSMDPGKIIMVGCDYTSEAQEAIRKGTQTGSVLFPLGGHKSVEIALKILKGEKVAKHIFIPVKLVTQENIDDVPPIF
ncbi:MAG: LacI family transcriptional regulator [Candidatus Electrothrix sp. ATG1]|nr:LacI family transcriptional regulator [Candidatus Electrothrix sp. ATG1]MCI5208978.1 LacI family transcriptional regulator [Candidatus Electrothrix sp. ATG2]